jgi:hypothetical protein
VSMPSVHEESQVVINGRLGSMEVKRRTRVVTDQGEVGATSGLGRRRVSKSQHGKARSVQQSLGVGSIGRRV